MNIYKQTWVNTIKTIIEARKVLNEFLGKEFNEEQEAMELARQQYGILYQNRPNKDLTPEEQANEDQLEFIEFLKYVKETGNYLEK